MLLLAQMTGVADAVDKATASAMDPTYLLILLVTVFVLAIFVGFEVITKVPPTLHTPLMSGSNAISGITIIGALLLAGRISESYPQLAKIMATVAVVFATINVVGGFLVTHRMLDMFRKK
jgi:NAD(P) transhydrogenase subunit alpha